MNKYENSIERNRTKMTLLFVKSGKFELSIKSANLVQQKNRTTKCEWFCFYENKKKEEKKIVELNIYV
jgi:hypothetical protein